jgi:hypothetical protein
MLVFGYPMLSFDMHIADFIQDWPRVTPPLPSDTPCCIGAGVSTARSHEGSGGLGRFHPDTLDGRKPRHGVRR